jgi:uncharacterized protein (TIGR02145 family)
VDGNTYSAIIIGDQIWMAENLKTTSYNDTTDILNITDPIEWSNEFQGAYCWFNNSIEKKSSYGAMYNWYTVNTEKLCPTGWRVPDNDDWSKLIESLGGVEIAGGKMKAVGTEYWADPNVDASNEIGFTARPGGYRGAFAGQFDEEKIRGWWWSSSDGTEYSGTAFVYLVNNDKKSILVAEANEKNGVYVRCVKDTLR